MAEGKYIKDFDSWHLEKKSIDSKNDDLIPYYYEREIWFCKVGCNIGYEQDGKDTEFVRPVVIIRKHGKNLFTGIPLTTKIKSLNFYFGVGEIDGESAMAVLIQVRAYSSKRLVNKIGMMDEKVFEAMKKATAEYIFKSA
ncbi:MAG: type II toxin-antitoxin system PemK/MazF family toxin [Candidatus Zambryskibacteria bacterium]|nr:type II toxin-antitoxin system PemK/MazF family toxin [Candidatus Zambryskibacteria bacterium]